MMPVHLELDDTSGMKDGESIVMTFDACSIKHPKFGSANISGAIPMLLPFGKYVIPSALRDEEKLKAAIARQTNRFKDAYPDLLEETIVAKVTDFVVICTLGNPAVDIEDPTMEGFSAFMIFAFLFDDILDSMNEISEAGLTYEKLNKAANKFEDILEGKYKGGYEDMPAYVPVLVRSNYYLWITLKLMEDAVPDYYNKTQFFNEAMLNVLRSFVLLREKGPNGRELPPGCKSYFGASAAGSAAVLEIVAIMRGANVSQKIRNDVTFQRMVLVCASFTHLVNDIFGLRRDIELDQARDSSILSQVLDEGRALPEIINETLEEVTHEIKELKFLTSKLRAYYPENEDLEKYIRTVEDQVDGTLYAYKFAKRYGDTLFKVVGERSLK